ncbi:MAG: alpha/beta hydrolase, partial [Bacteroidota bacterium]
MRKPVTQYTKSGSTNIAYQTIGNGPFDLVYIPGWVSNIDLMWDCPQLASFLVELSKITRVILFDKRGTGLSDRISDLSTLEDRMDDIRAVMDAVDTERAILFGHSEGGSVSALFAATYPSRTIALITFGVFAKRRYSPDYPWAPTDEERQKVYDMISTSWGSSDMYLASLAPSLAHDKTFMSWLASYFRSGASPRAALVLTKMNTQVDIIDILDTIKVPTLLMYRTEDIDVKVEEGRFIAERIEGSVLKEFPGQDHLFWAGDVLSVLDEMTTFIEACDKSTSVEMTLATILTIQVCSESLHSRLLATTDDVDLLQIVFQIIETQSRRYNGTIKREDDVTFTISFDGPTKALNCAQNLKITLLQKNIKLKQGIHIGECSVDGGSIYYFLCCYNRVSPYIATSIYRAFT